MSTDIASGRLNVSAGPKVRGTRTCVITNVYANRGREVQLGPADVDALIEALKPFATHEHRWVTDEDGVVHTCECGAPYRADDTQETGTLRTARGLIARRFGTRRPIGHGNSDE